MRGNDQLDSGTIDAAVRSLLETHPEAVLCAIGPDGFTLDMPDSVPRAGHDVVKARSPLDLVLAADRVVMITAWERARTVGAARAPVRLVSDPQRQAIVHLFDAQEVHGVYLGVIVAADGDSAQADAVSLVDGDAPPIPPRFARARQSELGVFLEVDAATTQILGWNAEDLIGQHPLDWIHPDDQGLAIDNWMNMIASPGPPRRVRLRHRHRDGSWVWVEITNHNFLDDPDKGYVLAEMMDIADEMAALEALRAREQLLERLAEALPVGVLQIDALRRVIYTNDRLHDILGTPRSTTLDEQLATVADEDRGRVDTTFDAVLRDGVDGNIDVRIHPFDCGDAQVRHCTLNIRPLTGEGGELTGAIVCVSDVTESARMRDELHMRANFDVLTQCHNRASTMGALEALLAAPDTGARPAVIFVDLDHFKQLNDQQGHAAGDEFLGVVARRLHGAVREDDLVGRIGGDEFLVVCPSVSTATEAVRTAIRISESLSHEIQLKTTRTGSRASIGVAWSSGPETDADTLVAQADAAMYESKRRGVGRPILFTPSLLRSSPQPS